jgi:5-(carboxyamino)imidazole ribonucleotide synthase
VSTAAADAAAEIVPVRPTGHALHVTQQRGREKAFLAMKGYPVTPFEAVGSLDELTSAVERIGLPAILKTASFGYDGKGQHRLTAPHELERVWALVGHQAAVLERVVDFVLEFSVVAARGLDGAFAHYGAIENAHRHHILDVSVAPARMAPEPVAEAVAITESIMEELAYVGVLCVEFFLTSDGRVLVNEVAPRPHNSGHLTVDASITSQFEQQVRAICGLPLGATTLLRPAAMANLIGDVWKHGEPKWDAALAVPDVKLHLYGKTDPRPGRKMGHLTALADTPADAIAHVLAARDVLA